MGSSGPPSFFVSVASKGVKNIVSLLFATLAGRSKSVAAKGLGGQIWLQSGRLAGRKVDDTEVPRGEGRAEQTGRWLSITTDYRLDYL
jgi:hypothetical protein